MVLAAADSPRQDSPALIVPLLIVNEGAGSGLVSGLALKVEGNGVVRMYTPIAEIDFGRFLSDRRKLHADNTISTFGPVPLQGESTARRHFVFIQEPSSERYPFAGWTPGKFTFRLFAKFSLSTNPREVAAVSHEITSALLASYVQGQSTSMSSSKEIDV